MDVAARADLKSDVMKDLDKQKQVLNSYRGNPAIAEGVLDEVDRASSIATSPRSTTCPARPASR